jgi:hypothetical protein
MSEFKQKILDLEKKVIELKDAVMELKNDKKMREAVFKLYEYDELANETFKKEYKMHFNPKRNEILPNLRDFINDPPKQGDDEYTFWDTFVHKHPGSVNIQISYTHTFLTNSLFIT